MVQVLEGDNAVLLNRELMGATNPAEAAPGTIRSDFAQSIDANAVHGSDSTTSRSGKSAISLRKTKSARAAKRPETRGSQEQS